MHATLDSRISPAIEQLADPQRRRREPLKIELHVNGDVWQVIVMKDPRISGLSVAVPENRTIVLGHEFLGDDMGFAFDRAIEISRKRRRNK